MIVAIDNIAVTTGSFTGERALSEATEYYPDYIRCGGKKHYQEYIQLVERAIDIKKELLGFWMEKNFLSFVRMAKFSNEYWYGK